MTLYLQEHTELHCHEHESSYNIFTFLYIMIIAFLYNILLNNKIILCTQE